MLKSRYHYTLPTRPLIRKMGTIAIGRAETTPVVFGDKLYRFEYVRHDSEANTGKASHFHFVDVASGEVTPGFAEGYHLGSAHVEGDTVFVYGVKGWGTPTIQVFHSADMVNWSSQVALDLPGFEIFNNSVCRGGDRYVMAFEIGGPPAECGVRFTMQFAESRDLLHWKRIPDFAFSKEYYTACPAIRFFDGQFYMIYVVYQPGRILEPYIARSRSLQYWELSPFNPLFSPSPEDRIIANPELTDEERDWIATAANCNNSDLDLCEYEGKVIIYYAWGNQLGNESLAYAEYDGPMHELFLGFFPDP